MKVNLMMKLLGIYKQLDQNLELNKALPVFKNAAISKSHSIVISRENSLT